MTVIDMDPTEPSGELRYDRWRKTWRINPSGSDLSPFVRWQLLRHQFGEMPEEIILIPYQDENIFFSAIAVDSNTDFCVAWLFDKSAIKTYLLIDKPGIEGSGEEAKPWPTPELSWPWLRR